MAPVVMSKEIGYISHVNRIRRPDEPETAFGATAGFDKPRPAHHLKNLRRLCWWEVGCRRDLLSLKRFRRIGQATKCLERLIDAWRKIGAKHDSYLSEPI